MRTRFGKDIENHIRCSGAREIASAWLQILAGCVIGAAAYPSFRPLRGTRRSGGIRVGGILRIFVDARRDVQRAAAGRAAQRLGLPCPADLGGRPAVFAFADDIVIASVPAEHDILIIGPFFVIISFLIGFPGIPVCPAFRIIDIIVAEAVVRLRSFPAVLRLLPSCRLIDSLPPDDPSCGIASAYIRGCLFRILPVRERPGSGSGRPHRGAV